MSNNNLPKKGYMCGKFYQGRTKQSYKSMYDEIHTFIVKVRVPEYAYNSINCSGNIKTTLINASEVEILEISINGKKVDKLIPKYEHYEIDFLYMAQWSDMPMWYNMEGNSLAVGTIIKPHIAFKLYYYADIDMVNNYLGVIYVTPGEKKTYHFNGNLEYHYFIDTDQKYDGSYKRYYRNGQLELETNYIHGIEHGLYKTYHENGRPKESLNYTNGKKDGEYTRYSITGRLLKCSKTYSMGKIVSNSVSIINE